MVEPVDASGRPPQLTLYQCQTPDEPSEPPFTVRLSGLPLQTGDVPEIETGWVAVSCTLTVIDLQMVELQVPTA